MLTATVLAATAGLVAAQATIEKNVPVGFKSVINLEDVNDVGYFEFTSVTDGQGYNPSNLPVELGYLIDSETTTATIALQGGFGFPCPATKAASDTAFNTNATAISAADLTIGDIEDYCTTDNAQSSSFLKYQITGAPASSLDVEISDSYLYFYDGNNMEFVPTVVTADNEAFRSFQWGYNTVQPGNSPMEAEGPVVPSIQFTPANPNSGASTPWLKVDMSAATTPDAQVSFCAHQEPLYTTSSFTFADCKAAAALSTPQAAWFTPSSTGDDFSSSGVWVGKQNGFNNGTWYITPFVTGVSNTGYFRVAVADGHEPLPASSVGPSLAVAGLVAAVAKALF